MEKRVDPSLYDERYYAERYHDIDYRNLKDLEEFEQIYQKAGSILQLKEHDKVVDFGCGTGHFSLYLYLKYRCNVIGIDYSQEALKLCKNNLRMLESESEYSSAREKIHFFYYDGYNFPDFENVRVVYLLDVVEHLYEPEVDLFLEKMKKWKSKDNIRFIIHTDSNNYLKFIQPIMDFLGVLFGKTTYQQLNEGYAEVTKGHVNLTTPGRLRRKLISHSFDVLKIEYPTMTISAVKNQLGPIADHWYVLYPVFFVGKIFYFLRPTFYMLAEYK